MVEQAVFKPRCRNGESKFSLTLSAISLIKSGFEKMHHKQEPIL